MKPSLIFTFCVGHRPILLGCTCQGWYCSSAQSKEEEYGEVINICVTSFFSSISISTSKNLVQDVEPVIINING